MRLVVSFLTLVTILEDDERGESREKKKKMLMVTRSEKERERGRERSKAQTKSQSNSIRLLFLIVFTAASIKVMALDAAMPFDYEARVHRELHDNNKLVVGIVGFGSFGQFLGRRLVKAGHTVIATSRSPYEDVAASMGIQYFRDVDDFCEEHPDVVILSTSILSLDQVLSHLPIQRLRRNTLFVDVLSVKEFPKRLLLSKLPREVDILCTHPMFGPDSGKGPWTDLNFMYEKVRIGGTERRQKRCQTFLEFFEREGCNMVEMTCEQHDKAAASTQFITHTVGRMLGAMELDSTPIDTRGYKSLLNLVDNTTNDSFDLYYGLFMYNQNATQELDRLERAFDDVKKQLFSKLHDRVRSELFLTGESVSESNNEKGSGNSNSSDNNEGGRSAAGLVGSRENALQEDSSAE